MDSGQICYLPINAIEMKIFERKKELDWLNQVSSWSSLASVCGLKGTGKMTLVRHWLSLKQSKARWISVRRFGKIPEVLGTPDASFERSLDLYAERWVDSETIVWRDFHYLSTDEQARFIQFLKVQSSAPMHILLSEESLDGFKMEMPILHLSPISESEIESYLRQFLGVVGHLDFYQILKMTGGFPFLINLWVQSPTQISSIRETALASLSSDEFQAMLVIQILPLGLREKSNSTPHGTSMSVSALEPVPASILRSLERRFFVYLEDGYYKIEPSLVDLITSKAGSETIRRIARICFEFEACEKKLDGFSMWVLALQTEDLTLIEAMTFAFDPQQIEGIHERDLTYLDHLIENLGLEEHLNFGSPFYCRMTRLHLLVLVLTGRRALAIEKGLKFSEPLLQSFQGQSSQGQLFQGELFQGEIESLWLSYEIVHWCQRSGYLKKISELLTQASAMATGELRHLFQLELSFQFIQSDPKRALKSLHRLIVEMTPPKNDKQKLVLANAYFQRGRASAFEDMNADAMESYQKADEIFRQIDQIYFSLLSRLNLIWIHLENKNILEFEKLRPEIEIQSLRYGYKYIRAGVLLAQAVIERWQLNLGSAYEKIQKSIELIPLSAPPKAKTDALTEKVLVLSSLGLLQEARKTLNEIGSNENRQSIEFEAQLIDLPLEEVIDRWQKKSHSRASETFWIYLLQRGQKENYIEVETLKKTKVGQWTLLEFEITERLGTHQRDFYLPLLGQMEQLLDSVSEILPERVALSCLQASLAESPAARTKWCERAKLELQRWGGDSLAKKPLTAWLHLIGSGEDLHDNPLWNQARIQDRERWGRWILPNSLSENPSMVMITQSGKKPLADLPTSLPNVQLVLIEHLGQVFLKKKELRAFHRKSILRQILALLFEVYPQGLNKSNLATAVWGETYSPSVHDSRIYTSIQRLRKLIHDDAIEAWEGGYRWNPKVDFCYIKSDVSKDLGQHKVQTLILQALKSFKKSGRVWASRSDILEATGSSESTIKRELSKLLTRGLILRRGLGPSVEYSVR